MTLFSTLIVSLVGGILPSKAQAQGLELRPLMNVRLNERSEAAQLVPEIPLVTRRLVAPSAMAGAATRISFAVALYPHFDREPIVLDSIKFKKVRHTIWRVKADGTLEYTPFNESSISALAHESGSTSGFVFTTASRSSTEPNSPSRGSLEDQTVNSVGAIYLSRKNMNFGPYPQWEVPGINEGYQMDVSFDVEVTYNGVTERIFVDGNSGLTAKYLVSEKTPEIIGIKPATDESAEVITTSGEDVRQFRMKWSSELGPLSSWQLILPPPTVQILSEGLAEWALPDMPVSPARYYVLEWTPEPQFYAPQFPVYSPDTTVGIAEMAMKGLFP